MLDVTNGTISPSFGYDPRKPSRIIYNNGEVETIPPVANPRSTSILDWSEEMAMSAAACFSIVFTGIYLVLCWSVINPQPGTLIKTFSEYFVIFTVIVLPFVIFSVWNMFSKKRLRENIEAVLGDIDVLKNGGIDVLSNEDVVELSDSLDEAKKPQLRKR